jgi:hypothetical protein
MIGALIGPLTELLFVLPGVRLFFSWPPISSKFAARFPPTSIRPCQDFLLHAGAGKLHSTNAEIPRVPDFKLRARAPSLPLLTLLVLLKRGGKRGAEVFVASES